MKSQLREKKYSKQSKNTDDFATYEKWSEAYVAYSELKREKRTELTKKRLSKLRKQIIKHYFKNFFLFPRLVIRFFIPSYMKGPVKASDNIRTLWQMLRSREFRPLRHAILSQIFFLYAIGQLGFFVMRHYADPVYAATYGWVMTDWSGGASTTLYATHESDQSGWTYFYSKDNSIDTSVAGEVSLVIEITTSTDTTDEDFNAAATSTNVYVPSGSDSVRLLKRDGASCTEASECRGGGCDGSNKCYTP